MKHLAKSPKIPAIWSVGCIFLLVEKKVFYEAFLSSTCLGFLTKLFLSFLHMSIGHTKSYRVENDLIFWVLNQRGIGELCF